MEDSEENMSADDVRKTDSQSAVKKPKKRSLVERELETSLTARITSPASVSDGLSTSRYGRARRLKTEVELIESQKVLLASIKSPGSEKTPVKIQSPTYRMHASNSPQKAEASKNPPSLLESQIDNIYQENASLSRFSEETGNTSPAKKFPKVYIRKDLIQNREEDEPIMLISNLFSPTKSASKAKAPSSNYSAQSAEKYNEKQNGHMDTSSVVKTLDFDSNKKKKRDREDKEQKVNLSKNELFELEAKCPYQLGDLAWARMGTFPFWPCIVTRDPQTEMFVRKKLFGRVEHSIIHVTFFGDNGRRSWVVDNMLRAYHGLAEFETTREKFTSEDKKKDPRLYAAFFISEKKQALWKLSVEEAESLYREPKRLRIDIFNDMLWNTRLSKKNPKSGKIIQRTNSDVSLSESLYDSLFSEQEEKTDDAVRSKNRSRNKSFDVSEVVTACLDNMAAKTGITKIQRQSHMDRWLQKAKSKTPEKNQVKPLKIEKPEPVQDNIIKQPKPVAKSVKLNRNSLSKATKAFTPPVMKPYRLRKRAESYPIMAQPEETPEDSSFPISTMIKTEDTNSTSIDTTENINNDNINENPIITIDDDSCNVANLEKTVEIPEKTLNNNKSKHNVENLTIALNDSIKSIDEDNAGDSQPIKKETVCTNDEITINTDVLPKETIKIDSKTINMLPIEETQEKENKSLSNETITESITTDSQGMATDYLVKTDDKQMVSNNDVEQNTKEIEEASKAIAIEECDSIMEVDNFHENNGAESQKNRTVDSVMEVDDNTDSEIESNRNSTPKFETVSKSVEHNEILMACTDTNLKDALNITTEVSVTEKKNDDTLNNLPYDEQQESIDKQASPSDTKNNDKSSNFLEMRSNHDVNMAVIDPKNSSTPEKFKEHDHLKLRTRDINKLNFQKTTLSTSNNINESIAECDLNHCDVNELEEKYKTTEDNNEDDLLNQSTLSESILQNTDEDIIENGGNKTSTTINDNNDKASVLEQSHTNSNTDKSDYDADKSIMYHSKNFNNKFSENNESSRRQYVESPTFTEPLDSEEFFRDEKEPPDTSIPDNDTSKEIETNLKETESRSVVFTSEQANNIELTQNVSIDCPKYVEQIFKHNKVNEVSTETEKKSYENIDDYAEETSDDEPSPEYESLDEEITEDFRKHMMSIEVNIKDKKDEDQLVKICNEIAEKAKLSPTKYVPDEPVVQHIENKANQKLEKLTTNKIQLRSKKRNNETLDAPNMSIGQINEQQNSSSSIRSQNNKSFNKDLEIKPNQNGDATVKEVANANKSNIVYRTRRSLSIVMKDICPGPSSPGLKIEASKIEQYRKSAEYAPMVLLTRLEQDQIDCAKDIKVTKALNENEVLGRVEYTKEESDSTRIKSRHNTTHVDTKLVVNYKEKANPVRNRLSLRRDSPKSIETDNKYTKKLQLETKIEEPGTQETLKKPEVKNKNQAPSSINFKNSDQNERALEPKEVDLRNISEETKIPEAVKVNGYHYEIDRKYTVTPDSGDTDFDIDAVSLNSEDSEISLPNTVESLPRRNLRSRPERTLENALNNTGFLNYLESNQNLIIDEHPELNEDEVLIHIYKIWQYEEDLKLNIKKSEETRQLNNVKSITNQQTPRSHKKSQPKNSIENYFRDKYEKSRKEIDFAGENVCPSTETNVSKLVKTESDAPVSSSFEEPVKNMEVSNLMTRSNSPESIDLTSEKSNDVHVVNNKVQLNDTSLSQSDENVTPKRSSRRSKILTPKSIEKEINSPDVPQNDIKIEEAVDASVVSEDSEVQLRNLRSKVAKEKGAASDQPNEIVTSEIKEIVTETKESVTETKESVTKTKESVTETKESVIETLVSVTLSLESVTETKEHNLIDDVKEKTDETATVSDNETTMKQKKKSPGANSMDDPDFLNYVNLKQDVVMDENPELTQDEIVSFLYKSWLYSESSKSDLVKNSELEEANLLQDFPNKEVARVKKVKKRTKVEKPEQKQTEESEVIPKAKPRRRIAQPFYNENYSDLEDELDVFEIIKTKKAPITVVSKTDADTDKTKSPSSKTVKDPEKSETQTIDEREQSENDVEEKENDDVEYVDDTEHYFTELTKPKPNVFKGLVREKVCEICEYADNLVKCKGCHSMFHPDCVKRALAASEEAKKVETLQRGRKKKIRKPVRKNKSIEDSGSHSDDKQDVSADVSMEEITIPEITFDADTFESQLELKMKEVLNTSEVHYDSYASDDGVDWQETEAGKCEIVDVKWKRRDTPPDYSDFKCHNCQKYDTPICFVCKNAVSKTGVKIRQKCHVAHCHKHYHLECLDQWPQTQFSSGEPSRNNKKINAHFETVTCPRHVCHTCVSDDPRGCKTRFSGDKLAKCVRCPATYHSFNKCLPAGSQVLTASHIICPRHCDRRAGKVPCHVNTGWCFICALGGSLICCEYCPTSFHAECLNIKPPEGNYMCEDCETGRLPLYGEMVWVKLGHYRWWPGIILHPSEIPDNIMLVKHEPGDFVVRFFGQYDHYWVNRGRVFPYQEGDSGRISSQKSKINEDFICAIEHAQRAYNILKNAEPDEEESLDIASSLLPPHYVKLKVNKPCGALSGRRAEDPSLSLTQCECAPADRDPCGPYSHCINRMLLTECGPTCRAGDRCMNRAFEKRQYPKLVPYRTPHRGWGLKTLENIKAGQFVIEYVGELIDEEEFRRRMRRKHEIRDENFYFLTLDKERMIDAGPKGNVARFMNHCCEPNCETQKWTVLGDVRVGLFAINDIPANSEVTFNYNLQCAGIEKKRCLCGAKRCSGYIGAKPKQDESQSKKIKRPYNKKKKQEESPSTSKLKAKRLGRPKKPRELTELEKDVQIIKNATSSISSDDSSKTSDDKIPKLIIKRKHASNTTPETQHSNGQTIDEKNAKPVRKKRISMTDYVVYTNGQDTNLEEKTDKTLKRKRVSNATEEVSLSNGLEPHAKKQKCDEKVCEVGD